MGVQGKKCCGRKGGAGSACCRHVDHQCRRLGWRCVCMRRLHYHGTSMFESAMCTGMRPVVCRWEAELSVCAACVGCACIACAHQSAVAGEEQAGRKNYHAAGHRLPATAALYKRLDWSESAIRVNGRLPIRLHQKGKPQGGFKLWVWRRSIGAAAPRAGGALVQPAAGGARIKTDGCQLAFVGKKEIRQRAATNRKKKGEFLGVNVLGVSFLGEFVDECLGSLRAGGSKRSRRPLDAHEALQLAGCRAAGTADAMPCHAMPCHA